MLKVAKLATGVLAEVFGEDVVVHVFVRGVTSIHVGVFGVVEVGAFFLGVLRGRSFGFWGGGGAFAGGGGNFGKYFVGATGSGVKLTEDGVKDRRWGGGHNGCGRDGFKGVCWWGSSGM
jgi:hypothetical protein